MMKSYKTMYKCQGLTPPQWNSSFQNTQKFYEDLLSAQLFLVGSDGLGGYGTQG